MLKRSSRRSFLKATAVAGFSVTVLRSSVFGANEKLHHASIGVCGMGGVDLGNFLSHPRTQVVAICDVDQNRLNDGANKAKDARKYTDWRELLDKEGDKIDSVNVTVPDHMHAFITLAALKAKKHVYCQKPLCHDVAECRAVAEAAKAAGVVTQLGTQHAAGIGDRMGVQMMKAGAVGKVKHVYLCSNRGGGCGHGAKGPRPAKADPVPANLNWNVWLGTAPERPFAEKTYHPGIWRGWLDFGTGWSGDIGCHIFDAVWKGLSLTAPKTVVAEVQKSWLESPERRADTWPQSNHVTYVFPGNELTEGDLTVEWHDGEFFAPEEVRKMVTGMAYPEESAFVIGTEGGLLIPHQNGPQLFPREKFKGYERPKVPGGNHYHLFADACLGGAPTESHFVQTGPMAEAIILGTVAIRCAGQKLEWDSAGLKVTNCAEAQKLLRREYRTGW
jgi:predicted dehydrogenase